MEAVEDKFFSLHALSLGESFGNVTKLRKEAEFLRRLRHDIDTKTREIESICTRFHEDLLKSVSSFQDISRQVKLIHKQITSLVDDFSESVKPLIQNQFLISTQHQCVDNVNLASTQLQLCLKALLTLNKVLEFVQSGRFLPTLQNVEIVESLLPELNHLSFVSQLHRSVTNINAQIESKLDVQLYQSFEKFYAETFKESERKLFVACEFLQNKFEQNVDGRFSSYDDKILDLQQLEEHDSSKTILELLCVYKKVHGTIKCHSKVCEIREKILTKIFLKEIDLSEGKLDDVQCLTIAITSFFEVDLFVIERAPILGFHLNDDSILRKVDEKFLNIKGKLLREHALALIHKNRNCCELEGKCTLNSICSKLQQALFKQYCEEIASQYKEDLRNTLKSEDSSAKQIGKEEIANVNSVLLSPINIELTEERNLILADFSDLNLAICNSVRHFLSRCSYAYRLFDRDSPFDYFSTLIESLNYLLKVGIYDEIVDKFKIRDLRQIIQNYRNLIRLEQDCNGLEKFLLDKFAVNHRSDTRLQIVSLLSQLEIRSYDTIIELFKEKIHDFLGLTDNDWSSDQFKDENPLSAEHLCDYLSYISTQSLAELPDAVHRKIYNDILRIVAQGLEVIYNDIMSRCSDTITFQRFQHDVSTFEERLIRDSENGRNPFEDISSKLSSYSISGSEDPIEENRKAENRSSLTSMKNLMNFHHSKKN